MVIPDHLKDHMVRLYGMGERLLVKTGGGVHMLHLKFRPENMFWLHSPKFHFVLLGPAQCHRVYAECLRRCARLFQACFPIAPKKILKTMRAEVCTSLQSWAVASKNHSYSSMSRTNVLAPLYHVDEEFPPSIWSYQTISRTPWYVCTAWAKDFW